MSSSLKQQPDAPAASPDDALPPVEAPSMAFVFQLFVVPLLIVSIIVVIWLAVNWLVSVGSSPEQYVRDLQNPGKGSWQSAAALADMLRNPTNDELKRDPSLALQLAEVLENQIEKGDTSEHAIKLRIFLARALGEFEIPSGLPALVLAINTERQPIEAEVRRAAIEAVAVLADNTDPERVLEEDGLLKAVMAASMETSSGGDEDEKLRGELRARAAFALGVLGGDRALERLSVMTSDAVPDVRFNAAIGLARHGDARGERVLVQMLDPNNQAVVEGEEKQDQILWKRALVIINGLEAAEQLARRNDGEDELKELRAAVARLTDADLDPRLKSEVRRRAVEVQARIKQSGE